MCGCMCIPCYALTLCCQDVSSFVSYLPRCPIFRQAELCACMCVDVLTLCCQDVSSFVFCQLLAKMPHLSAGGVVCVHVCECVDSVLSRCLIFCQLPAKMPHLSAGRVTCFRTCLRACVLQCMSMCICIDSAVKIFCQLPAKLPHLLAG